jgi:anhydro-N-acetylmuramic acid kinase
MRVIGLMSGTSVDGIDVADVDVKRTNGKLSVRLDHFTTTRYGSALREALFAALPPNAGSNATAAELNFALGEAFADAILAALRDWGIDAGAIDLIASHGHTLYHAPQHGVTLQIGEAAVIAARTGITCVSDFRTADIALGGQGAPLVPFVDRELFAHEHECRVALNIGGIANVTILLPGGRLDEVIAFDTGPGNLLIDECARLASGGTLDFDRDGVLAAAGAPDEALLSELLRHPYFAASAPKSTGRETFGAGYARAAFERVTHSGRGSAHDAVATMTALTARTIAREIPERCDRIIVSGGGAHNPALLAMLRRELSARPTPPAIEFSDIYGVPVDAKEAVAFAVLGFDAVCGSPNNLPKCTGARAAAVLGKISPGKNYNRIKAF